MRIKEVSRTSNISWSPGNVHPMYIAAGTSAKQLDASFSSSSTLELFEVDTSEKGWDMPVKGSINVASRFNVIKWGSVDREMGLIAGGGDNGVISLWDPSKILSGEEAVSECELPKHCGPVRSMDFNPAKKCLMASGASSSEIHIVDISKPDVLMTPGPKAQPEDDVVGLAWNQQVEHILASAHPNSARTIVWDLRKNEAIIQVTDASNRLRCSCIAWHPDIATQLLTCSDEDRYPVIQMWDLRNTTSPMMVLEGHARGIQTLAWCGRDSGMLLTCSRDDHVICWNPNSSQPGGEKIVEFMAPNQWTFDLGWCPRNPYLVGSSSFSGKMSVFSLFGGQEDIPAELATQRVRASSDPFAPAPPAPPQPMNIPPLSKAPKWLMKPCGVKFGFGGKLLSFDSASTEITILQVTTEHELLERAQKLELALQDNTMLDFCCEKAQASEADSDKQIWGFLKSTFDGKPRQRYLELLGYRTEDLPALVSSLGEGINDLQLDNDTALINKSDADSSESGGDKDSVKDISELDEDEQPAASVPLEKKKLVFDTTTGLDGLICRAMLLGQFETVVDLCLKAGRMADALAVAMAGGRELFQKTQQEYFKQATSPSAALLSCIISQRWSNLIEVVELGNWKEALAILLSYAKPTDFNSLCDLLAGRLSADPSFQLEATLCYICSGNVAQLLEVWQNGSENAASPLQLQELIEKVMCLQSTSSSTRPLDGDRVITNLLKYSQILAEQGKLSNALTYINATPQDAAAEFKYQLHMALNDPSLPRPPVPYIRTRLPSAAASVPATPTAPAPYKPATYAASSATGSYTAPTSYTAPPASNYAPPASNYAAPASNYAPPASNYAPPASNYAPPASNYAPSGSSYAAPYSPSYTSAAPYSPSYTSAAPSTASVVSGTSAYTAPAKVAYQAPSFQVPEPVAPAAQPASQPPTAPYSQPYNPTTYNPYNPTSPAAEPAPSPPKPISRPKGAWNDPPLLKKKAPTIPAAPTQKITTPVVGPIKTVDLNPNSPANYGPPQSQQPTGYNPAGYEAPQPDYSTQQPVGGYGVPGQPGFQAPQQPAYGAPQQPSLEQQPAQQPYNPATYKPPTPEPKPQPVPVEKPPVPEHYGAMLAALEDAAADCKAASQNMTHRRKLDEATAKLEALKDKLRYDAVSGAVVADLNGIAQAVSIKDYNQALQLHTRIAQTANFSEVGSFLPGIKVLLQIGAHIHTVHHY